MKEHSGGTPDYGLDKDWHEESLAVTLQHPVFTPATFKDELADRIRAGEDIEAWVAGIVRASIAKAVHETVRRIVALLADTRKPRLKLHQVLWAFGFNALLQSDASGLAKCNKVSKQAFQQGVERIRKMFNLPLTRAMRCEQAREAMSQHNHRKEAK
jgi:hypothetical protein